MYVLILTIAWSGYSSPAGAAAIDHITGFTSSAACVAAGNAWIKHMDTPKAKAICVKAS